MRIRFLLFFVFRLLSVKKWQYGISFLGIFLGILFLLFFLSLSSGIKNSIESQFSSNTDLITLQALPKKIAFFETKLNEEMKQKILSLDGVSGLYAESSIMIPSFAQSSALLNFPVDIAFLRGIDPIIFNKEASIEFSQFDSTGVIPVLISPFALDFLNSLKGKIPGFTGFSKENLIGKKISLTFGKSAFIPLPERPNKKTYDAQIVGVTTLAPVVGLMFSENSLHTILKNLDEPYPKEASFFHVKISDINEIAPLTKVFQSMGFFVDSQKQSVDKVVEGIEIVELVLLCFSGVLLLLSFLFLFSTISISVLEHIKTIGILRSLGTGKFEIQKIFFIQGFVLTISATILAIVINYSLMEIIELYLVQFSDQYYFFPEQIFSRSFLPILWVWIGVSIATIIAVYFPVYFASKKDPMLALIE